MLYQLYYVLSSLLCKFITYNLNYLIFSPIKRLLDGRKAQDKTRWLNSPNTYSKVEVLETGTPDPKKITKVEYYSVQNKQNLLKFQRTLGQLVHSLCRAFNVCVYGGVHILYYFLVQILSIICQATLCNLVQSQKYCNNPNGDL